MFKRIICLLSILGCGVSMAETSLVYSGTIGFTSPDQHFVSDTTRLSVQFRLYSAVNSTQPLWGVTTTVGVDYLGEFQVRLSDNMTDAVYDEGNTPMSELFSKDMAHFIGISIEGEQEINPRQEILYLPMSEMTDTTKELTSDSSIDRAKVTDIYANNNVVAESDVAITGSLSLETKEGTFNVGKMNVNNGILNVKDNKIKLLNKSPFDLTFDRGISSTTKLLSAPGGGGAIDKNENGGFLVIISKDNWSVPCVTIPVAAGAQYYFPADISGKVALRFFPFGN